jgi:hypothetical protein
MASWGDDSKHPCNESPRHDCRQPPSCQARTDASSSRALPLVRWVFTRAGTCLGLLLCHDVSLFIDYCRALSPSNAVAIELLGKLLAQESELDCREGGIASWRMDWQPLSMPLERSTQNVMLVASKLRLSSMTSLPRRASLAPGLDSSPTSIGHWRDARSFFAYRGRTWRCERRY